MTKRIFSTIHDPNFTTWLGMFHRIGKPIIVTSGGFDPMHIGHVRCLLESADIKETMGAMFIVIVNGDDFLRKKKGKPFMPHDERMEIVRAVSGVDFVVGWDPEGDDQTVIGALEIIKPDVFTKGGDRSDAATVPEAPTCERLGCQIMYGVGGGKIQSSSDLIAGAK